MGGFGDGVLDELNRRDVRVPLLKVALRDAFVDHGSVADLRRDQRIDAPGILEQVRERLARLGGREAVTAPRAMDRGGHAAAG